MPSRGSLRLTRVQHLWALNPVCLSAVERLDPVPLAHARDVDVLPAAVRPAQSESRLHPGGAALPNGLDLQTRYHQNFRFFFALGAVLPLIDAFDTAL